MTKIVTLKIHPAIGIARLGNSPDGFFIGPEIPGVNNPPDGGYKDSQMRVKRQAARFRIFGYDKIGNVVKEITGKDAEITWTVHLANKKAAWKEFDGLNESKKLRNASEKNRKKLVIDGGVKTLHVKNSVAYFNKGRFYNIEVPLGEMRTDDDMRLLVLGGFGNSASITNKKIEDYANNDSWYDDVSDGPVTALVKLKGSSKVKEVIPAWVICPPPDFAPSIDTVISLHDTLQQVAIDKLNYDLQPVPSFTRDIYPLLLRAINLKWVSLMMYKAHKMEGSKKKMMAVRDNMHTSNHELMEDVPSLISDPTLRQKIFEKLTDPNDPLSGDDNDMPMMWSDHYGEAPGKFTKYDNQPLCRWQYDYLKKWAEGNFKNDWNEPPDLQEITPEGLDKAAIENCVGGPFFPGIEGSWYMRDKYTYSEPFRLSHKTIFAGDVTKQMAIPWQADFYQCQQEGDLAWWPAQRPDYVFPEGSAKMKRWTRSYVTNEMGMVKKWSWLGFVIKIDDRFEESERKKA